MQQECRKGNNEGAEGDEAGEAGGGESAKRHCF